MVLACVLVLNGICPSEQIEWGMRLRILYVMELKSCNNGTFSLYILMCCSVVEQTCHIIEYCAPVTLLQLPQGRGRLCWQFAIMMGFRINSHEMRLQTHTHISIHPPTDTLPYGGSSTSKQWQHVNESVSELNWLRGWTGVLWGMTVGVKWSGVGVEGTLCHQYVPAAYSQSLSQESASSYKWRMIIVALHLKTRTTVVVVVEWELGFLCLFNDDKKEPICLEDDKGDC